MFCPSEVGFMVSDAELGGLGLAEDWVHCKGKKGVRGEPKVENWKINVFFKIQHRKVYWC